MFTCPTRAAPAFAAIDSPTVPAASPLSSLVTAIQLSPLTAVQWQPVNALTSTLNRPPAWPIESLPRLSVNTHGAAVWLTATRSEPTTMAADRAAGTGFAATAYDTVAPPCPLCSPPMVTQPASVAIDQVQSRAVTIVTAPLPPAAVNVDGAPLTFIVQRSVLGAVSDVAVLLHAPGRRAPATISNVARWRIRQRIGFTERHRRQVSRQRQRRER